MSERTGPAWEPKIINAHDLWALREVMRVLDYDLIGDDVLDTMVAIIDGVCDPAEWQPETRRPHPDHRIVSVADLRKISQLLAYDEHNANFTSQEERDLYRSIKAVLDER